MAGPDAYISVILPLRLEWEPCYTLPSGMDAAQVCVGDRVKVIFANKEYSGVVSKTGIIPETEPSKIKPIICIEEGMERIHQSEIELWRNVAEYYLCTIGEVYKAAYPGSKINLEEARAAAILRSRARKEKIIEGMREKASRIGLRLKRKEELIANAKDGTKAKLKYSLEAEKIRKELEAALKTLSEAEGLAHQEDAREGAAGPGCGGCGTDCCNSNEGGVILSEVQEASYFEVKTAFEKKKPVLLHGITGSGKTEIYMKLAQEAFLKGQNVLYLVPEIALSRQLEERLATHFGDSMLTFHSRESAAGRRSTAEAVRTCTKTSRNYIVLGTRSALFLPHQRLGLIIVDEEHDNSYKQDSPAPRYNGRDTALMLSVIHGSNIILGSATPSLEELYNCRYGKHILVRLTERYHGSDNAEIEIIDTRAERRKRGMCGSFSRKLIDRINSTLASKGQVMILRSRRAWSPALQCEECGEITRCPHCSVSLSYHKSGRMVCHYCGSQFPFTGHCSKCGGNLIHLGAGTQKIEEEADRLFPQSRIARLDSDSAQDRKYEIQTIKSFSKGEIDILVGTQMLAKGFDFSNLKLVAVISADTLLGIQDFRADEKALQILEQFRGRCGRRDDKGLFVIQTSQPEHPIYQRIANRTEGDFTNDLLTERKDFNFPPFTRIVEIVIKDTYEDRAIRMADSLVKALPSSLAITGPYSPAVDRIADQNIRTIRISLSKDKDLSSRKAAIKESIRAFEKDRKYEGHITVNVDPV